MSGGKRNMNIANRKEKAKMAKGKASSFRTRWRNLFLSFLFRHWEWIISAIILALGLFIRYRIILRPYGDVRNFLFPWAREIKSLGFKNFYKVQDANYSTFYLFFLGLISLLPSSPTVNISGYTFEKYWMIGLKSANYVFDILLALGVFFLLRQLTDRRNLPYLGAWITFLLPVQLRNSALWGQCDNFWTCAIIWSLYFLLKKKDGWSWFLIGVGISVKIHRIFVLPLYVYFWLKRKTSFYKVAYALIGFLLTCLPAFFCGASFKEVFGFMGSQVGTYNQLNLGCANRWQFFYSFSGEDLDIINKGSLYIALGLIALCFLVVLYHNPDREDKTSFILVCAFLVNVVPFFLPHRHERYFYSLDIFALLYCLTAKKDYFLLLLTQASGNIAYFHYRSRFEQHFIPALGDSSVTIAAAINLFVLAFLLYRIRKQKKGRSLKEEGENRRIRLINEKQKSDNISKE